MQEEDLPVGVHEDVEREVAKGPLQKEEPLFASIVGYDDVKRLFSLSLSSDKPVHILLVGPPASAKTLFMLECMKLERSYFTLGSHSTKSGMIDYLFEKRPRHLIVDEIEHMPMKDQTALLSLMETGIVAETKFQKTRNTQLKTWVFATSNGTDRMLTPLLSRFVVLHFKQYSFGSFAEVCTHILGREGVPAEIAGAVADAVWNKLKSKDVRDCIKLGRLAKSKEDVEWLAQTLRTYR
ncbi:MAG: ATP-binding protein [Nitrososphaera sp.]|uniref:ATP-binding protein n=1 Tax=Nitrososphaera sp. TaxID=1971748 RepID=UPI003D6E3D9B